MAVVIWLQSLIRSRRGDGVKKFYYDFWGYSIHTKTNHDHYFMAFPALSLCRFLPCRATSHFCFGKSGQNHCSATPSLRDPLRDSQAAGSAELVRPSVALKQAALLIPRLGALLGGVEVALLLHPVLWKSLGNSIQDWLASGYPLTDRRAKENARAKSTWTCFSVPLSGRRIGAARKV
jgi:hypothetical protein